MDMKILSDYQIRQVYPGLDSLISYHQQYVRDVSAEAQKDTLRQVRVLLDGIEISELPKFHRLLHSGWQISEARLGEHITIDEFKWLEEEAGREFLVLAIQTIKVLLEEG